MHLITLSDEIQAPPSSRFISTNTRDVWLLNHYSCSFTVLGRGTGYWLNFKRPCFPRNGTSWFNIRSHSQGPMVNPKNPWGAAGCASQCGSAPQPTWPVLWWIGEQHILPTEHNSSCVLKREAKQNEFEPFYLTGTWSPYKIGLRAWRGGGLLWKEEAMGHHAFHSLVCPLTETSAWEPVQWSGQWTWTGRKGHLLMGQ